MKMLVTLALLYILTSFVMTIGFSVQKAMFIDECNQVNGVVIGEAPDYRCATDIKYIDLDVK